MKSFIPRIRPWSIHKQKDKEELLGRIQSLLEDERRCKKLLESKGDEAQKWLDVLQTLSDFPAISSTLRSSIFKTMLHLSKRSGLCPQCLTINNVKKMGDHPVGGGGFGDVWKGMIGEQMVCLKVVKVYLVSDVQQLLKEYMREAIVWKQLKHPNLLPFMGMYYLNKTREQLCLVSPWMARGNLVRFLKETPRNRVDHHALARDVAAGLCYLHNMKIVHGDLKGVNVLITPEERACIGDFGLSFIADSHALRLSSSTSSRSKGTLRWLAPELLISEQSSAPSTKTDMYAYGCVCYEIFAGRIPFYGLTEGQALLAVAMDKKHPSRPNPPELVEDSIWEMMVSCWDTDPSLRATAMDVLAHLGGMVNSKTGPTMDPVPEWNYFTNSEIWNNVKQSPLNLESLVQLQNNLSDPMEEPTAPPSVDAMQTPRSSFSRGLLLNSVAEEILESERRHIQGLETIQRYSAAVLSSGILPKSNMLHRLLSSAEPLLSVQRKFLVRLQATEKDGALDIERLGQEFALVKNEFLAVYVWYASRYPAARHSIEEDESELSAFIHILDIRTEVLWTLGRPLSRVRNYPLLLDSLLKASILNDLPQPDLDTLKAGAEAVKMVADRVDEAVQDAENALEAEELQSRVDDWKGYNLETFGKLVLHDLFLVTKKGSSVEREFRVFLFESVILFLIQVPDGVKPEKNLSGNKTLTFQELSRQRNRKLALKGQIHVHNIIKVETTRTFSATPNHHPVVVWWKISEDDDADYFVFQTRREPQMRKLEGAINRVVRDRDGTPTGRLLDDTTRRLGELLGLMEN